MKHDIVARIPKVLKFWALMVIDRDNILVCHFEYFWNKLASMVALDSIMNIAKEVLYLIHHNAFHPIEGF